MPTRKPKRPSKAATTELGYPIVGADTPAFILPEEYFWVIDPDSNGCMLFSTGTLSYQLRNGLSPMENIFPGQMVFIERQWARPFEGVSSSFKSGLHYGRVFEAVQRQTNRIYFVNPATWTKDIPKGKGERVALVAERTGMKLLQKDHGFADAYLFLDWIKKCLSISSTQSTYNQT